MGSNIPGAADTTDLGCRYGNPQMWAHCGVCCGIRPHFNWVIGTCEETQGTGQFCANLPDCVIKGSPKINYVAAYQYNGGVTPPAGLWILSAENFYYGAFYMLSQLGINLEGQGNPTGTNCWMWELDPVEGSQRFENLWDEPYVFAVVVDAKGYWVYRWRPMAYISQVGQAFRSAGLLFTILHSRFHFGLRGFLQSFVGCIRVV
ncbi:unnamed protein product [Symbiodinium sp. CCMP2456]|nr:unnamed protein product [Symbiodinium sp. CCMP2456]